MAKKVALGKGLKALIPTIDSDEEGLEGDDKGGKLYKFQDGRKSRLQGKVAEIQVANVRPNPYQPRQVFEEEALEELAASIQQLGIIQPITVRTLGDGQFELISGERRLRASRRAGLEKIPAYVREADTEEMLEMAIVENVQREQLNPIEVAIGYQRLIEECDLTQEKIAKKVGKKRATVANFLRLLKLPAPVQAALRDESISMGHARALIPVDDKKVQLDILTEIEVSGLSVRDVERRVRAWQDGDTPDKQGPTLVENLETADADRDQLQIRAFADHLRAQLSTQVQIKHKKGGEGGKIEIAYYSNDDLERLMELLGQQ
ncbi:MAG: ParB/RepB/Spo0J family partition protein [Bacteroidota bacterium]